MEKQYLVEVIVKNTFASTSTCCKHMQRRAGGAGGQERPFYMPHTNRVHDIDVPDGEEPQAYLLEETHLHKPAEVPKHRRVLVLAPAVVQLQEEDGRQLATFGLGRLQYPPTNRQKIDT